MLSLTSSVISPGIVTSVSLITFMPSCSPSAPVVMNRHWELMCLFWKVEVDFGGWVQPTECQSVTPVGCTHPPTVKTGLRKRTRKRPSPEGDGFAARPCDRRLLGPAYTIP